ncbi:hypothetical protein DTO217A2_674 [Paecilomyces variotii]|nr:hypothetical protein DTO217A2_674 [Paecilomyces variotii]
MESCEFENSVPPQLNQIATRLALYQHQLDGSALPQAQHSSPAASASTSATTTSSAGANETTTTTMARDPITCHVLNTLTGTPAANLPVTLTLLTSISSSQSPVTFHATTDSDGRVKMWTPASSGSATVSALLSSLPAPDSKTSWSVRFEVGPWYEAQGVESFWPEVEVKFTVKGRGKEGEEGWRHYHVPVLLGPWNYSTYRGS